MELMLPWVFGFIGVGVGLLIIGGNSAWLFAFAYIPVVLGYWLVWPR